MAMQVAKAPKPTKAAKKTEALQPNVPTPPTPRPIYLNEIRLRAYLKWQAAGQPPGDGVRFWLAAEQELLNGK